MVLIRSRTLHIYSFYLASARIFNWQYTILLSLFQLFRGKKHNVLRKRIDSCDYDLDQLLLGTILFTLLFFLLPTVVVFYLTFACSRMAIISLKAALDTLLACLNHFPLFALMLRIKDSQRLPGMFLKRHSCFLTNEHKVAFVLNFEIPNNFLIVSLTSPLHRQPRTYFSE
jgi:phosphatidylinositol glycan class Q protein